MIDLHGLQVAEAIAFAKDELQSAKSRGDEVVRFIVGESFDKTLPDMSIAVGPTYCRKGVTHGGRCSQNQTCFGSFLY